ncbi:MAG: MBL fold metallo-hydrolase [Actinobacteria bacterium]|nr:MBL fold metallo-hydrolase [Actinomycetota bacterium]
MDVQELAPGLWRWTALHPAWQPSDAEDGQGWEQEVGCVYLEATDTIVLIDPQVPEGADRERFLAHLDADVARGGKPVAIVLTVAAHERSAPELAARYSANVWAHEREVERWGATADRPFPSGAALPGGVTALDAAFEIVLWLPAQSALVVGDILLGSEGGAVRVCPDSWLRPWSPADVRKALRPLLDLPLERILVGHGEPVLVGGHAALAAALTV